MRYVKIPMSHFDRNVVVTEDEIKEFYLKNQPLFSTEEEVSVEYIEIKSEQFITPVEQQDLINEYESVKQDYEQPQENRISHILLVKKNDESEQEYGKELVVENKLSEGLDLEVHDNFQMTWFCESGGDLGFSSGDAFPEKWKSLSELVVGEVSDRVGTEANAFFNAGRKEKSQASFEDLQEQLTIEIQSEQLILHCSL